MYEIERKFLVKDNYKEHLPGIGTVEKRVIYFPVPTGPLYFKVDNKATPALHIPHVTGDLSVNVSWTELRSLLADLTTHGIYYDSALKIRLREGEPIEVRCIVALDIELTIKTGRGMTRGEFKFKGSKDTLAQLPPNLPEIRKTRTFIDLGRGRTAELDTYHDQLEGLQVVEVEFPDVTSAQRFVPPSWFGEEVTNNLAYATGTLARFGLK